jgi:hypothetical protein
VAGPNGVLTRGIGTGLAGRPGRTVLGADVRRRVRPRRGRLIFVEYGTNVSKGELPCRLFPGETILRNPNGRVSRYIPTWPVMYVADLEYCVLSNRWDHSEAGHTPVRQCLIVQEPGESPAQRHGAGSIRDVNCSRLVTLRYMDIQSVRARYVDICDY